MSLVDHCSASRSHCSLQEAMKALSYGFDSLFSVPALFGKLQTRSSVQVQRDAAM